MIEQFYQNSEQLKYFFLGMTTAAPFLAYKIMSRVFRKTDLGE